MSKVATRLFLVRHGAALGSEGIAVGQIDLSLSPFGTQSIEKLAASWKEEPPDRLISSDLLRASETARILNQHWGLTIETDARLREMDFGRWDGKTWQELRASEGKALDAWMEDWRSIPAPEGESFDDLDQRVRSWFEESWPSFKGQTIVVAAHGGSIRSLICQVLGLDLGQAFHFYLDHGRVSGLFNGRRGIEVRFLNSERFPGRSVPQMFNP